MATCFVSKWRVLEFWEYNFTSTYPSVLGSTFIQHVLTVSLAGVKKFAKITHINQIPSLSVAADTVILGAAPDALTIAAVPATYDEDLLLALQLIDGVANE